MKFRICKIRVIFLVLQKNLCCLFKCRSSGKYTSFDCLVRLNSILCLRQYRFKLKTNDMSFFRVMSVQLRVRLEHAYWTKHASKTKCDHCSCIWDANVNVYYVWLITSHLKCDVIVCYVWLDWLHLMSMWCDQLIKDANAITVKRDSAFYLKCKYPQRTQMHVPNIP